MKDVYEEYEDLLRENKRLRRALERLVGSIERNHLVNEKLLDIKQAKKVLEEE